jgi:exopolysaccharide biosynthesis WecB/TagA/CpsF family protein
MDTVKLLGVDFDDLEVSDVVKILLKRSPGARFAYVVTPNADHLARLRRLPQLRRVYDGAWLRLLDSQMLRRAAEGLGLHAPHVATGADISAELLDHIPGLPVAVIGLDPQHMRELERRYPAQKFMHHVPPKDLLHDPAGFRAARDFAVRAQAAYTFLAVGSPVQELLAYAIALQPESTGIGLCIGAALEFRAGARTRAPAWMRSAGLEWLHRLISEPKRLGRRYLLDDPPVLFDLITERFNRTAVRSRPDQPPRGAQDSISARDPYRPRQPEPLHEIPGAR